MREKVANVFLYVAGRVVREVGLVWHDAGGTDAEKIQLLQEKVWGDWKVARRHPLPADYIMVLPDGRREPGALSYDGYRTLCQEGRQMDVLEPFLALYDFAPRDPVLVVTPVVDGRPRIEGFTDMQGNVLP